MRLAENAITKYTIPSWKRNFRRDVLPDIRTPIVERTNIVRVNPIAGELKSKNAWTILWEKWQTHRREIAE